MRRAPAWLPLLHGVPLLLYLVGRTWITNVVPAAVPERLWWTLYDLVSLVNEFTPFFFLPLPLWLVTAALSRTRGAALAAALPWLLFAWLYGELFVPRRAHVSAALAAAAPEEAGMATVRVMTFNVLGITRAPEGLAETIKRANPDVVIVQEVNPWLAQGLDAALLATYPHRRLRPAPEARGAGIWSRFPIQSEEAWTGSRRNARWQHAVLTTGAAPLHVVNLHLTPPALRWRARSDWPLPIITGSVTQGRSSEVAELAPRLRELAHGAAPLVVAGDLNLTDQTPEYRRLLATGLADAHRRAGWGFGHTFPAVPVARIFRRDIPVPVPLLRLDYILYSARVEVRRASIWSAGGASDHLPVVADLVVRRG